MIINCEIVVDRLSMFLFDYIFEIVYCQCGKKRPRVLCAALKALK